MTQQVGEDTSLFRKRWRTLLGCHLALAGAASPIFVAGFSLFLTPMADNLHRSRGELALGMSLYVLASTLCTPFAGYLLDRLGAALISLISVAGFPLAILVFALSPGTIGTYLAASALVGIMGTLTLPITYVSILPQWFDKRLGLATALVVSGLGSGAVISALIASRAIDHFGWQGAWMVMAAWSAFLAFGGRFLIPWREVVPRAVAMDGSARPLQSETSEFRSFTRDPRFWFLSIAFMLGLLVTLGVQTNVAGALTNRGFSPAFAATTVAVTGMSSAVARLVGGALLDWFSVRIVGGLTFASQACGCLLLALASTPAFAITGAALVSFAYGVEADMIPYVIRRRYGVVRFGRVYGIMYALVQLGAIIGPAAVASSFDKHKNYDVAFVALAACSAVASLILIFAAAGISRRAEQSSFADGTSS